MQNEIKTIKFALKQLGESLKLDAAKFYGGNAENVCIAAIDLIEKLNSNQWQPIETAPKDGSKIIVYRPNYDGTYIPKVGMDFWMKDLNCWGKSRSDTQPTHWQPLPKPPGE